MRRRITLSIALFFLALNPSAGAIVNGAPDENRHPSVGALLAPEAFPDGTWVACSGTLISPTVFLTAAHCDLGAERVAVTFDTSYDPSTGTEYWGTWHADPAFNKSQSDPHDLAVVVLDSSVNGITPARLPRAGSLSSLAKKSQFTAVGYGAQSVTNGPGGKTYHYEDTRFYGVGTLNTINKSWLKISQNSSHGNAGTCYGDSGGPNFLGAGSSETDIIAGTTITGDSVCRSTNVDYRLDTASARAFLGRFVVLP